MITTQQPSKDAFTAYWKDYGVFRWRQVLWYVGYLGGLAVIVFAVRAVDADGRFLIPSLVLAATYLVSVPYFTIRRAHTKFARFIRCPQCGDRFGRDASGAYHAPNPKSRGVIETGCCGKCGARILSDV